MRSYKILFILLFFIYPDERAFAQDQALVTDAIPERVFHLNQLEYFVDTVSAFSIQNVVSSGKFILHHSYQNKDFISNASYWIKFPVAFDASTKKKWIIEFYDQTIDHLEAYVPQEDGTYKKLLMGDHYPFSGRTFLHKNF